MKTYAKRVLLFVLSMAIVLSIGSIALASDQSEFGNLERKYYSQEGGSIFEVANAAEGRALGLPEDEITKLEMIDQMDKQTISTKSSTTTGAKTFTMYDDRSGQLKTVGYKYLSWVRQRSLGTGFHFKSNSNSVSFNAGYSGYNTVMQRTNYRYQVKTTINGYGSNTSSIWVNKDVGTITTTIP